MDTFDLDLEDLDLKSIDIKQSQNPITTSNDFKNISGTPVCPHKKDGWHT